MILDIVTPTRRLHSLETEHLRLPVETERVRVPGNAGEFEILPGHAPYLAKIGTGLLSFDVAGKEILLMVSGGFCDVDRDRVTIMCESAALPEEVRSGDAEHELQSAEKGLAELGTVSFDNESYTTLRTEAERATAKLRLLK